MLNAKNFRLVSSLNHRAETIEVSLEKSDLVFKDGKLVKGDKVNFESTPYELADESLELIRNIYTIEDNKLQALLFKRIPTLKEENTRLVELALVRMFGNFAEQTEKVKTIWEKFMLDRRESDFAELLQAKEEDKANKEKKQAKKAKKTSKKAETNKENKEETNKEEKKENK